MSTVIMDQVLLAQGAEQRRRTACSSSVMQHVLFPSTKKMKEVSSG